MTMQELGEQLKKKRVEQQVSLMDISAETRINLKFLEAIEQGNFAVLPQTYVRAIIREYAAHVGLPSAEVLEQYETAQGARHDKHDATASLGSGVSSSGSRQKHEGGPWQLSRQLLVGAILLGAGAVVVLLIRPTPSSSQPPRNPEVVFDSVIRETEAANVKRDSQTAFIPKPVPIAAAPVADSLRLEMVTKDTVWISLLIDGKRSEQYLVAPNRKRTFVAREQFSVTMGNAGGAVFTLNGKELPPLGRRGAVIRNTVINQASLKPL